MAKKFVLIGILAITAALLLSAFTLAGVSGYNGSRAITAQSGSGQVIAGQFIGDQYPSQYSPYLALAKQYREHVYPSLSSSLSSPKYYFVPYMEMSFLGTPPMFY
jgi:hypothetical protein